MIKSRWFPVILLAVICITWVACTQERQPCLTPKKATLIINSVHFATDTSTIPVDSLPPHANFWPVTTDTVPYILYTASASLFSITLSPNTNVCQWALSTDTTATRVFDTLTFYYERIPKFISNACGYTYFYNLDSVHTTRLFIDSVRILNPGVTNVTNNVKNVQIFIRRNF